MKFLLLVLACLVAAEEPLPFSGKFNTIYLASRSVRVTGENSPTRMLMREVKYFKQYKAMSMTFYVRINGTCQLRTVWADRAPGKYCSIKSGKCPPKKWSPEIAGTWILRRTASYIPNIYHYSNLYYRGAPQRPEDTVIVIHFATSTTIIFQESFVNLNYLHQFTGALSTGTNITEDMWNEYLKVIEYLKIPTKNIENVYETDVCPKLMP